MDSDRLRRAEAEAEAAQLRVELERLEHERSRLTRKLERLTDALYALRDGGLDEAKQLLIEDALGFDGREPALPDGYELSGFNLLPEDAPEDADEER